MAAAGPDPAAPPPPLPPPPLPQLIFNNPGPLFNLYLEWSADGTFAPGAAQLAGTPSAPAMLPFITFTHATGSWPAAATPYYRARSCIKAAGGCSLLELKSPSVQPFAQIGRRAGGRAGG